MSNLNCINQLSNFNEILKKNLMRKKTQNGLNG